jgi:hypothetical protein
VLLQCASSGDDQSLSDAPLAYYSEREHSHSEHYRHPRHDMDSGENSCRRGARRGPLAGSRTGVCRTWGDVTVALVHHSIRLSFNKHE